MGHVTYAWYIRGSAITFQINSYLSINIAYTSPQLQHKLSILQKSKIQEILLEHPYFYLRKNPNPAPPSARVPGTVGSPLRTPPGPPEGLFGPPDIIPPYGSYSSNLSFEYLLPH